MEVSVLVLPFRQLFQCTYRALDPIIFRFFPIQVVRRGFFPNGKATSGGRTSHPTSRDLACRRHFRLVLSELVLHRFIARSIAVAQFAALRERPLVLAFMSLSGRLCEDAQAPEATGFDEWQKGQKDLEAATILLCFDGRLELLAVETRIPQRTIVLFSVICTFNFSETKVGIVSQLLFNALFGLFESGDSSDSLQKPHVHITFSFTHCCVRSTHFFRLCFSGSNTA